MELSKKNLTMLGNAVRLMCKQERMVMLTDEQVGNIIVQYVNLLDKENQRDARDTRNGKGE